MIKPSLQNDISLAHQRIVKRVVAKAKNATAHPDARSGTYGSEMFTTPEAAAYIKMAVQTLERLAIFVKLIMVNIKAQKNITI